MRTLRKSTLLLFALVLVACPGGNGGGGTDDVSVDDGFDDGFDDGQFDPCAPRIIQNISNNHGHAVVDTDVDEADLAAGRFTFEVGGRSAGHSHSVTLLTSQFEQVSNGGVVTAETTSNSLHTHKITAGVTLPPGCGFDDGFDDGAPPG